MTAEIALLNKESVALAADSAVTIRTPGGMKIIPSANKIFMLSKYHPVGVMIYGNAQLLGVPWELVIKLYRKHLGSQHHPRLQDYAEDLIKFIERSRDLFPESLQEEYIRMMATSILEDTKDEIEKELAVAVTERGELNEDDVEELILETLTEDHQTWLEQPLQPSIDDEFVSQIHQQWSQEFSELIAEHLQQYAASDEIREMIVDILVWKLVKAGHGSREIDSGLVVAGYGNDDVYPALRSYTVESVIGNRLIHSDDRFHDVNERGPVVMPFAQIDVVYTFMEGVDQNYQRAIDRMIPTALQLLAKEAIEQSGLTGKARNALREELSSKAGELAERIRNTAQTLRVQRFADPALEVVDILPKDRLAAMAEALVNITVFRRQFSVSDETVGGPIDVAVISKGDGFVWIKRKHYFEKHLNPQFFHNYFLED